ncbi:MAG: T9SS type A sorting domain-containing protein [Bacteroidales bacterium]|nr:T9SS type A sorting domain-containing protein [Bacteroidales bacterium]
MKKLMKSFLALLLTLFCLSASAQFTVSGGVYYHNNPNKPLANIQIDLKDGSGNILQTTFTNQSGQYSFANVPAGTYTLSASTNLPSGGVTLQDAVLILMNVLGLYNLTPIQQLAADVDGNGVINMNDYFTVVFGWFLYGYPFPSGDWVFTDATVVAGLKDGNNMGGTSSADVNGSFVPNYTKAELVMASEVVETREASENEFIEIPVYPGQSVDASAFALYFEYPADLFRIDAVESRLENFRYTTENGLLKVVWAQTTPATQALQPGVPLFTVKGMTLPGFRSMGDLTFSPITGSHVVDADGNIPGDFKLGIPRVEFKESPNQIVSLYPNPVNENTLLMLNLSEDSRVRMNIFNSEGRLISTPVNHTLPAGIHTLSPELGKLARGTYHYTITLESNQIQTIKGAFIR